jgi:hypothetical protein
VNGALAPVARYPGRFASLVNIEGTSLVFFAFVLADALA